MYIKLKGNYFKQLNNKQIFFSHSFFSVAFYSTAFFCSFFCSFLSIDKLINFNNYSSLISFSDLKRDSSIGRPVIAVVLPFVMSTVTLN
jgi:hypothetical protein